MEYTTERSNMPNMNNNYEITGKYGPTFRIGHTQYVAEVSLDQFATMTIHYVQTQNGYGNPLIDFDYENSPIRDMIVDRCRSATLEIERESYENFYFGDRSLA
jgi:outer membrane phospholipase A